MMKKIDQCNLLWSDESQGWFIISGNKFSLRVDLICIPVYVVRIVLSVLDFGFAPDPLEEYCDDVNVMSCQVFVNLYL